MKKILILLTLFLGTSLSAQNDTLEITFMNSINGHAVISGHLKETSAEIRGVTVKNGGLSYSTITGPDGKWSVVIQHRSRVVDATAWSLDQGTVGTVIAKNSMKIPTDAPLISKHNFCSAYSTKERCNASPSCKWTGLTCVRK